MNYYEAIRAQALKNVLEPDLQSYLRKIFRWYSKTFFTSLNDVYDLPIEHVLQEYYEDRYESMGEEDRQIELEAIVETEEQRKARQEQADIDALAEHRLFEMSSKPTTPKKMADLAPMVSPVSELAKMAESTAKLIEEMATDPAEIAIEFKDDEEFQRLLEQDFGSSKA